MCLETRILRSIDDDMEERPNGSRENTYLISTDDVMKRDVTSFMFWNVSLYNEITRWTRST